MSTDPTPKFWQQVNKTDTCWLWTGHHDGRGYGALNVHGRRMKAHRFAWTLVHGPIPDGFDCCHKCDVKLCVRADHLFIGTALDNMHDMIKKGRQKPPKGEQCFSAKLTENDIKTIRNERANGAKLAHLSRMFNVSMAVISAIARRKIWKHVH